LRVRTRIGPTALLRAERSVIAGQFGGRRGDYRQFLQVEGMTAASARDVVRDQLLAAKVARGLRVPPIRGADVTAYVKAHAGMRTRSVETVRPVRWLVGQTRGVALLGGKVPLPRAERSKARLAVRALLLAEARRVAFREWLAGAEQAAVDTALCRADDVPVTGRSRLLARWPQLRLQP
jgi:hypothetical protein